VVKNKASYGNRKVERPSGLLAIIISFLVIAAILTQLDIKPDYSNILEDLSFLNENITRLKINAFIWLSNAILIIFLGPSVLITFLHHGRSTSYLAAFLISSTGILYLFFTGTCFNIIRLVSEYAALPENGNNYLPSLAFSMLINKTNLQLIAYTLTGISSVILGSLIARTGYLPRFIGWMSITGGLVYMVFGWLDTESLIFSAGRVIFVLSLLLFGSFLLLRGTRDKKSEINNPPSI
jgi:MFS family permease